MAHNFSIVGPAESSDLPLGGKESPENNPWGISVHTPSDSGKELQMGGSSVRKIPEDLPELMILERGDIFVLRIRDQITETAITVLRQHPASGRPGRMGASEEEKS